MVNTFYVLQNGLYRDRSPSNRQVYSSTITVSKTIYDPDAVQQEMVSASSASPRLQASPRSTLDRRSTGLANSPSLVGGNLSELDTLLDDLSTSAKMYSTSTLERRAAGLMLFTGYNLCEICELHELLLFCCLFKGKRRALV